MPVKGPTTQLDRHCGLRLRAVREGWHAEGVLQQESFANAIGVQRTALAN